jgi:hypothetical protein
MSALSLRLPGSIDRHIREIAKKEGVSINQFISSAVSEKISALKVNNQGLILAQPRLLIIVGRRKNSALPEYPHL